MTAKTRAAHAAPAHAADSAAPIPTPSTAQAPAREGPLAADNRTALGPGAAALLEGLFARALPNLTADDLGDLAVHAEAATTMVVGLSDLCMGLGCLLSAEAGDVPPHARSGAFQRPEELARLLFLVSSVADQAHGLLQLASLADTMRSLGGRA